MLNFCSLYSGSSGNSLFVESENTKILIDAGMSCKKIEEALKSIDIEPSSINAILVTHEHSDHVKGVSTISRKFDIPVFSTKETFEAMPTQTEKISENNINYFKRISTVIVEECNQYHNELTLKRNKTNYISLDETLKIVKNFLRTNDSA